MGKNGRTKVNEEVLNIVNYDNYILADGDFDGIINEEYEASIDIHTPQNTGIERIVKEFSAFKDLNASGTINKPFKNGFMTAITKYLKRNAIFLSVIFLLWVILGVEHSYKAYNIPVIGNILSLFNRPVIGPVLRFFTATYNGPMSFGSFMKPTLYGYLVAFVAKPIYLLAMSGVILPYIKSIFNKSSDSKLQFGSSFKTLISTLSRLPKDLNHIGLSLSGTGLALMFANFLTRNGKIDKGFVPILLGFVFLVGINGPVPSILSIAIKKIIAFITNILSNEKKEIVYRATVIQSGCIIGFGLSVLTGNIGQYFNYTFGAVLLIGGAVLTLFVKEKTNYGH